MAVFQPPNGTRRLKWSAVPTAFDLPQAPKVISKDPSTGGEHQTQVISKDPSTGGEHRPQPQHCLFAEMDNFQAYEEIRHFLKIGVFHHLTLTSEHVQIRKDSIRRSSKNYLIQDGQLYLKACDRLRLVVMNAEERNEVLRRFHDYLAVGVHPGRRRVEEMVRASYHWAKIRQDVKRWVDECPHCQQHKAETKVAPPASHPWSVLGMAFIGPRPATSKGKRYILVVTDLFTKFVIAKPIHDKAAGEVAKKIENILLDFGMVDQIMTDENPEFVNQVNCEIAEVFGVEQCITSISSMSRTNNSAKQCIKKALERFCVNEQNNWDIHLRGIVSAINNSTLRSTKTPFYSMFGRHSQAPGAVGASKTAGQLQDGETEENPKAMEAQMADSGTKMLESVAASQEQSMSSTGESAHRKNAKSYEEVLEANRRKRAKKVVTHDVPLLRDIIRKRKNKDTIAMLLLEEDHCYSKQPDTDLQSSVQNSGATTLDKAPESKRIRLLDTGAVVTFITQDKMLQKRLKALICGTEAPVWRHGKDGMSRVRFDEEQLDAINSTLSEVLEATHTANLTTIPDRGTYIQNVLLPEATICAIATVHGVNLTGAKELYRA